MLNFCEIVANPKITKVYTTYYRIFDAQYRFKGETHDFWELVCVVDGKITVAADEKVFEIEKGQGILHSPLQFHNITVMGNEPATVAVFTFSGENIPEIQNNVLKIDDIHEVKRLNNLAKEGFEIKNDIVIMNVKEQSSAYLEYAKRLELFLLRLAENCVHTASATPHKAKNYSSIVKAMNDNIDKRLTVGELAMLCNMSKINLQKTFSHYAGVGVMEYFNRLKVQYATELLRKGLSVKEAGLSVGFEDQNYFSTVFKRISGHTPSTSKQ